MMISINCHCGNVTLKLAYLPDSINRCDCPMCNRLGALWGHYSPKDIQVEISQADSVIYQWGDRNYDIHHCGTCGCTTHYIPTESCDEEETGINFRMADKKVWQAIQIIDPGE